MILVKGLSKRFEGHQVLKSVDLEIQKGETMVIMGRSGCGKSVLLKLIIGLLEPDEGIACAPAQSAPADRLCEARTAVRCALDLGPRESRAVTVKIPFATITDSGEMESLRAVGYDDKLLVRADFPCLDRMDINLLCLIIICQRYLYLFCLPYIEREHLSLCAYLVIV